MHITSQSNHHAYFVLNVILKVLFSGTIWSIMVPKGSHGHLKRNRIDELRPEKANHDGGCRSTWQSCDAGFAGDVRVFHNPRYSCDAVYGVEGYSTGRESGYGFPDKEREFCRFQGVRAFIVLRLVMDDIPPFSAFIRVLRFGLTAPERQHSFLEYPGNHRTRLTASVPNTLSIQLTSISQPVFMRATSGSPLFLA